MPAKSNGEQFICFGGGDWWYHNQAHIDMQLMRRFAQIGEVLYINSVVIQKPKFGKNSGLLMKVTRKLKSILKGLKPSGEGFWVYSPFTLPVHHISWARPLNNWILKMQVKRVMRKLGISKPAIWVACPGACETSIQLDKRALVWQRTDRWEEFPNIDSDTVKQYDLKLKAEADLTVFVSELLFHEESSQCRKAFYLDHGVDYRMFSEAEQDEEVPSEIVNVPKPIVGFFGGIDDHTSDIGLIEKVIELLPEMSFVFIGKASSDISGIAKRENVRLLGQKPYKQIPHYGKCFDVAIMPWRQNRWIEACNPIKLKEYLALGKPVVSTPFAELQKYQDVVYEANTAVEFAECIKQALSEDNAERTAARKKTVEDSCWDSKAKLLLGELFGENCEFKERIDECFARSQEG